LNDPVRRVEFARQLYNRFHLEVEEDEDRDTAEKTKQLDQRISSEEGLVPLYAKFGTKQKRRRTDDSGSASGSGGGGGQGTPHSAELRAHGYEVQSQVILDANGGIWEPLFEVWQPLSTYYTPL